MPFSACTTRQTCSARSGSTLRPSRPSAESSLMACVPMMSWCAERSAAPHYLRAQGQSTRAHAFDACGAMESCGDMWACEVLARGGAHFRAHRWKSRKSARGTPVHVRCLYARVSTLSPIPLRVRGREIRLLGEPRGMRWTPAPMRPNVENHARMAELGVSDLTPLEGTPGYAATRHATTTQSRPTFMCWSVVASVVRCSGHALLGAGVRCRCAEKESPP